MVTGDIEVETTVTTLPLAVMVVTGTAVALPYVPAVDVIEVTSKPALSKADCANKPTLFEEFRTDCVKITPEFAASYAFCALLLTVFEELNAACARFVALFALSKADCPVVIAFKMSVFCESSSSCNPIISDISIEEDVGVNEEELISPKLFKLDTNAVRIPEVLLAFSIGLTTGVTPKNPILGEKEPKLLIEPIVNIGVNSLPEYTLNVPHSPS